MILAAGLTPAWQHMLVFERLRVGEVNRAIEAQSCASGKVTNVGLALHFLGRPNHTLGVAGGIPGRCIEEEFASLAVDCRWIPTRNPTRECTTVMDRLTGATTELVQNASPIGADEIEAYLTSYTTSVQHARLVVMSGSLPPGAGSEFYRRILERTPQGARVIIDARGPELLEALPLRPFLVKPNREELGITFGRDLKTKDDFRQSIKELHTLGAQNVLVSDGGRPVLLSTADQVRIFEPLKVDTVNPIGCGDCLAAGTACALLDGMALADAVRFGIAAAAENAGMMLPSRLDPQRVLQRMGEVKARTVE